MTGERQPISYGSVRVHQDGGDLFGRLINQQSLINGDAPYFIQLVNRTRLDEVEGLFLWSYLDLGEWKLCD